MPQPRAVSIIDPQDGEQILDLCAAPGGKTTHILEAAPKAHVMAVDIDEQRLARVKENLQRLRLHAEVKLGDGRTRSNGAVISSSTGSCWTHLVPPPA